MLRTCIRSWKKKESSLLIYFFLVKKRITFEKFLDLYFHPLIIEFFWFP